MGQECISRSASNVTPRAWAFSPIQRQPFRSDWTRRPLLRTIPSLACCRCQRLFSRSSPPILQKCCASRSSSTNRERHTAGCGSRMGREMSRAENSDTVPADRAPARNSSSSRPSFRRTSRPAPLMNSPQTRWRGYLPASQTMTGTSRWRRPIPSVSPARPPPTIVMGFELSIATQRR